MGIVWRNAIFSALSLWILGCIADFAFDGVLQGPGSWDGHDRAFLAIASTIVFGVVFYFCGERYRSGYYDDPKKWGGK